MMYPIQSGCLLILVNSSDALNAGEFWMIGWNGDMAGIWDAKCGEIIPSPGEKTGCTKSGCGDVSRAELVTSAGEGNNGIKCSSSSGFDMGNNVSTSKSSPCDNWRLNEVGGSILFSFRFVDDWFVAGTTNILEPVLDFFLVLDGNIWIDDCRCMDEIVMLRIVGLCLPSPVERQPTQFSGVEGRFFVWLVDTNLRLRSYKSMDRKKRAMKNFIADF